MTRKELRRGEVGGRVRPTHTFYLAQRPGQEQEWKCPLASISAVRGVLCIWSEPRKPRWSR